MPLRRADPDWPRLLVLSLPGAKPDGPSSPRSRPDGPSSPRSPDLRPNFMTKCYLIAADLQTMQPLVYVGVTLFMSHASFVPLRRACPAINRSCGATSRFKIRSMSFLWLQTSCSQTRSPCQLFMLTKPKPVHGFHGVRPLVFGAVLTVLGLCSLDFVLKPAALVRLSPKRKSAATMVETSDWRGDLTMSSMACAALHA